MNRGWGPFGLVLASRGQLWGCGTPKVRSPQLIGMTALLAIVPDRPSTILEMQLANGGGADDKGLELGSMRFRMEKASGEPLTQAELNGLITSLGVVEDDGSGTYGPEDQRVLELDVLTVDPSGHIQVPFPKDEDRIVIRPGERRKFFIVMTPSSAPHQTGIEQLSITAEGDLLVVRGRRRLDDIGRKVNYHLMEVHYGEFERVFAFTHGLAQRSIKASYEKGFLMIEVRREPTQSTSVSVRIVEEFKKE